ncbi:MAG: peptide ABC transporter substrate-binding protein [Chloroflexota bacterium]|nr:peptide ABC transporter substrate-binding protein [Chloroflexota bacterium]
MPIAIMMKRLFMPATHCTAWRMLLFAVILLAGCSVSGGQPATPTTPTPASATPTVVIGLPAPTSATIRSTATTAPAPTAVPTGTPRPPVPTPTPASGAKPTPKGAQTLTLTGPDQLPDTLDPALIRDSGTAFIARQVFRGLVRLDDALNVVPDVAADYQKSPDGRSFTFFLRSTAKFQNGRPITADDVAFSLRRACDPSTASDGKPQNLPAAAGLNDVIGCLDHINGRSPDVAGIRVLDPLTIMLVLDAPKAYFLQKLTLPDAAIIDRNDLARGPRWSTQPNGSGPFRVTGWKADEITLTKFDQFYDQIATLDTVTILVGARAANPLNLYDGNKLDVATVPVQAVDRVSNAASSMKNELRVIPTLATTYIGVNTKIVPLDAFNVRAALIRTIDRQKIDAVELAGKVTEAHGIVPPAIPGGKWDATIPVVDAKTAKDLLPPAAAKALPAITFGTGGSRLGETVKAVAERDLGVRVDVEESRFGDYLGELDAHTYGLFVVNWVADYPDPENFLDVLFHTGSPRNYSNYSNPKVDALLDQANVEQDATKRTDLYRQAQQQILDDVAVIPLYHGTDYALVKPAVKGLAITAMGILRLETVWVER